MPHDIAPCAASCSLFKHGPDAFCDEPEGARVPDGLRVLDAHVHLFPPRVSEAIWRWFDEHGWRVRYRLHVEQIVEFMASRGVRRFCALHYAHKPGMAASLNRFVAEAARASDAIIPMATVLPGEPDAREVLREAFGGLGLRGVKLHCHVQRMPADDPRLLEVYEQCEQARRPVIIHAGRQPSLGGYGLDPTALCGADQIERVLRRFPRLTLVVPHLGADEFDAYAALLDRHENLFLDTTMTVGDYFSFEAPRSLFPGRASRLLYGTDFPNIPYAWDRELKALLACGLDQASLDALLWQNASRLFE